ncbi:MAG: lipid kinase YegS [Polyangiales bacterium]
MSARIILHGKQGANQEVRDAVEAARERHQVEVRVTWEAGDARRFAREATAEGVERVIAGGGDGSINEVLDGLLEAGFRGVLGVLPLGTANDFARSAGIPAGMDQALELALSAKSVACDVGWANERAFLNVATGGFGTEVTTSTDATLKEMLGGAAYFLTGVSRFASLEPSRAHIESAEGVWEGDLLALAVGNGRQAGGGQVMCPEARVDDGLLDVTIIPYLDTMNVVDGLRSMLDGSGALDSLSVRWRVAELSVSADEALTLNLDGEPVTGKAHHFQVEPNRIQLALPENAPLLESSPE